MPPDVAPRPQPSTPAATSRSARITAGIFLVGAGLYALGVGALGVSFDATPIWFGAVALTAGLVSHQARLTAIACPLLGWGTAVLLTRHGPSPRSREAAASMIGVGVGMLIASLWARRRDLSATGAACTIISGGVAFFLAFDVDALARWPLWCVLMVVWAGFEAVSSRVKQGRA